MAYTTKTNRRITILAGALCALVAIACSSQAVAGDLDGDPAALPGWTGSIQIPSGQPPLRVDVDYAVYAPGTLGNSAYFDLSDVPDAASEYVYAYQIFNDIGGTIALHSFSVGLSDPFFISPPFNTLNDGPDDEAPSNDGWVSLGGSFRDPSHSAISPNDIDRDPNAESIVWEFNSSIGLDDGEVSSYLVFTSTGAPEWDFGSISGGGMGGDGLVPSPTAHMPEPSTLFLGVIASSGLLVRRRISKNDSSYKNRL